MNGKVEGERIVNLIIAYNFDEAEEKLSGLAEQVKQLPEVEGEAFIKAFSTELAKAVEIGIQEDVIGVLARALFR